MRVGLLTTSFPRHDRDVAGAFVLGFARALHAGGHEVDVLAPQPREAVAAPSWPGIAVTHVPYLRPRFLQRTFYGAGVPDNLRRDALAWLGLAPFSLALSAAARSGQRRWQALVSHWALPCALAAGFARSHQRHVAVLHSADVHLLRRLPGRRALAARIARGADALWFVSHEHEAAFLELLPRTLPLPPRVVCPMGIELPSPECGTERAHFRSSHGLQGFNVLLLSRLIPIKGIDIAIRAAAGGGMTLLIAGEGPERGRLERCARALGADVRFIGCVTGAAKSRWFAAADAFALPSRRVASGRTEGLPTALLEAMAHGLPVVAARVGGIAELLGASALAQQLVTPDDPRALRAALLALRDSEPRALAASQLGRQLARRFAWQHVGPRICKLIEVLDTAPAGV